MPFERITATCTDFPLPISEMRFSTGLGEKKKFITRIFDDEFLDFVPVIEEKRDKFFIVQVQMNEIIQMIVDVHD